jgi:hypothetical protein
MINGRPKKLIERCLADTAGKEKPRVSIIVREMSLGNTIVTFRTRHLVAVLQSRLGTRTSTRCLHRLCQSLRSIRPRFIKRNDPNDPNYHAKPIPVKLFQHRAGNPARRWT